LKYPECKTLIWIDTVINPIWDTKPLKILENLDVEISTLNTSNVSKQWANYVIRGENIGEASSIIEAKLFRLSHHELWEYHPISIPAQETKVEDFLKEFRDSEGNESLSVSLKYFLHTNWSQTAKHLRVVVLTGRKFLPMKAGKTGGNIVVKIEVDDTKLKTDIPSKITKPQKLSMQSPLFWGHVTEFYDVKNYPDLPVIVTAFDVDEKYGDLEIGHFSLNLRKIFESSINTGGGSVERWYKLIPSHEAKSAISSFGSYWGLDSQEVTSLELSLRFLTFV